MGRHAASKNKARQVGAWLVAASLVAAGQAALGVTNTSDDPNSAWVFSGIALNITAQEDVFIAATSYKGFNVNSIFGRNQGGDTITWTAEWYSCDAATDFKATDADYLNATNDQVANESALDALLTDAGCLALPSSGGFGLTEITQSNFRPRYDFADFDSTGQQFITVKLSAAVAGEITTYAISDGFDRPTISPRTMTVSNTGVIAAAAPVTEGSLSNSPSTSFVLCPQDLTARNDISQVTTETLLTTSNCKYVYGDDQFSPPTNTSSLVELEYVGMDLIVTPVPAAGYLHVLTAIRSVVHDISAGVEIFGTPTTPTAPSVPYEGPIGLNFSAQNTCVGDLATVTGSRLGSIDKIYIDNTSVPFTLVSDSRITFSVPDMKAGNYQVKFWVPVNSLNLTDSITIGACGQAPVVNETPDSNESEVVDTGQATPFFVAKRFTNYQGDIGVVAALDRRAITMFIQSNPGLTQVTCVGSTSGQPVIPTDQALAMARAKNACSVVESLVPGVEIKLAANTGRGVGQFFRAVTLFGKGAKTN